MIRVSFYFNMGGARRKSWGQFLRSLRPADAGFAMGVSYFVLNSSEKKVVLSKKGRKSWERNIMTCRTLGLIGTAAIIFMGAASAQDAPAKWDPDYEPPRLSDGTPSFAGVWSKASLTTLERGEGMTDLVLSPEQARAIEAGNAAFMAAGDAPTDPDEGAPKAGDDIGGYNSFWFDQGEHLAVVDGEYRSSWIVDPEDGKIPYSEGGQKIVSEYRSHARGNFDNPEIRPTGERCTVGFGSAGTPPMMNVLYNNHIQFFQAEDVVSILAEMNHNARMVRIGGEFRDEAVHQWMGDSVGEWDGDTLVVRTTNFHEGSSSRGAIRHYFYLQPDSVVEERFTRVADDVIFYEFTVTDPELFSQPWKGEMPLWAAEGPIYEYACHEGNYALPGILRGARRKEADQAALEAADGEGEGGGQ